MANANNKAKSVPLLLSKEEHLFLYEEWLLKKKNAEDDRTKKMLLRSLPPQHHHSSVDEWEEEIANDDDMMTDFHVLNNGKQQENTSIPMECTIQTADDFFKAFPECMRDETDDDDDEWGDDDEMEVIQQNPSKQPPARSPLTAAAFAQSNSFSSTTNETHKANPFVYSDASSAGHSPHQQQQQQLNPSSSNSSLLRPPPPVQNNPYSKNRSTQPQASREYHQHNEHTSHQGQQQPRDNRHHAPAQRPMNPYARKQQQQPIPQQQQAPTTSRASSSSWDAHTPSQQQQHQPWDQQHNPFQTAREYAQSREYAQQSQRPDPPPLANQTNAAAYSPPPPPPPAIRESLKRKFQPPVKRNASQQQQRQKTNNIQQTHRGNNNNNNAGQNPPSSNPNKNHNEDTNENDDLPDELQQYGKELVEAIENEIISSIEAISFAHIAGLNDQKAIVREVVCWPLQRPDLFTGLRRAPNGLLLYGPPGTGKTLIGKAIANESEATFFGISSSSLTSKWMGQGEKLVRTLFAVAAYRQPAVVFIDEIDSLLKARSSDENEATRRIKTEFLVQIDGVGNRGRVLVIGATNRPQELDEAARRRFTKRLYIPLPEHEDREALLRVLLDSAQHTLTEENIQQLARDTAGFSGADLKSMSVDAAMGPLRELVPAAMESIAADDIPAIQIRHFQQSLASMKPSVAPQDIVQYEEWDALYGSKRATAAS